MGTCRPQFHLFPRLCQPSVLHAPCQFAALLAVHRCPGAATARVRALAAHLSEHYDGPADAESLRPVPTTKQEAKRAAKK